MDIINLIKITKKYGLKHTTGRALRKLAHILENSNLQGKMKINTKKSFHSIVKRVDVMNVDWTDNPYSNNKKIKNRSNIICWVISPPSQGGGHQNMFRFIEHLDISGYINKIYLYSAVDKMTTEEAQINVSKYAKLTNATFHYYQKDDIDKSMPDAIFATGWETCYPVFNIKTSAKKLYFIQDYEPYFYPVGTEYLMAENTYKFGFYGVTAGKWLARKLRLEYGMHCDYYNFGSDHNIYKYENDKERKEVFFYARPSTERRAFDLGIMTLEIFHRKNPEYTINLAGWDVSSYDIPFPYVNHKILNLNELNKLYNKCAVGLVISLTNMSLLPLELLSSGAIPVVNDGDNNRQVTSNNYIKYTFASPLSLAQAMCDVLKQKNLKEYSKEASKSTSINSWSISKQKFQKIIEKEIYG